MSAFIMALKRRRNSKKVNRFFTIPIMEAVSQGEEEVEESLQKRKSGYCYNEPL